MPDRFNFQGFYLIPRPLLLEEKGCNNKIFKYIAPLLKLRGCLPD
jgi:hypothetical protein